MKEGEGTRPIPEVQLASQPRTPNIGSWFTIKANLLTNLLSNYFSSAYCLRLGDRAVNKMFVDIMVW